jgi:alkanesulfonate monooxygenase SsuD/methylene tetrahydromethanopterin reductase-like flavin-dependent oxidoreductase (luciferase family)
MPHVASSITRQDRAIASSGRGRHPWERAMKFGVLQFFSWPGRRVPLAVVYERALERIRIMDQTGYDAVWLAEHHFTDYSVCPSIHMMGVRIADRTDRLRIGMAVSLAAFYHPLRLAEEVALLDVLTGGRVNWGAGRGFDPVEFAVFGIPMEESARRFREAVEIVIAAWTNERLTWSSPSWEFVDVEVLPKPHQRPHPPTWLAAGSPGAICWAGARGFSIMLGPHSTFRENAEHRALYRDRLESHGHSIAERDLPMARFLAVAESDREAEDVARRGVEWVAAAYMNESKASRPQSEDQLILTMDRVTKTQRYIDSVVIHGSPARVIDQIEALRETMSLDYLLCAPLSQTSFMLFTEEVLPRFL